MNLSLEFPLNPIGEPKYARTVKSSVERWRPHRNYETLLKRTTKHRDVEFGKTSTQKKNAQKTVHKSVTVSCLFCRDGATRKTISVRYPTELCQVSKMECWKGGAMHSIHASFFIFLVQAKNVWGIVFLMFFFEEVLLKSHPFFGEKNVFEPREMAYFNWNPSS